MAIFCSAAVPERRSAAEPGLGAVGEAGTPRDAKAAAALARNDGQAPIPLVLPAVLPSILAPQPANPVSLVIGVVSRMVFVVHERLLQWYLSTHPGKIDLLIVMLTAPWFLLPGAVSASERTKADGDNPCKVNASRR